MSSTPPSTDPSRRPARPGGRATPNTEVGVRPGPLLAPSPEVLAHYNARVLDPTAATRLAGQPSVHSTVYIADRLIVNGRADHGARSALEAAAGRYGLRLAGDDRGKELRSPAVAARLGVQEPLPIRVRLVPSGTDPTPAPDAWNVLQAYRATVGRENAFAQGQVALDHLMSSARHTSGSPFTAESGVGLTAEYGPAQYGLPGFGARMPVTWTGAAPVRRADDGRRRPVVAVLDTGIGDHDWLREGVELEPMALGVPIANPELSGITDRPLLGWLDSDAGHGTFIAGLIRQHCPDANILAVPIMGGDGNVAESDLVDALHLLALRQQNALATGDTRDLVDVVSLSLGYYHELPGDVSFDGPLLEPLRRLGAMGVAVVVAAGNDSTDRPMFPAAFAPWDGGPVTAPDPGCVPLVSVGALNPNRTVALFSNAGRWVTTHRFGAAVVSTFPTTFNGAHQASDAVFDPASGTRALRTTIDPDDFRGGFGVWSGTSFAAPVLAAEIAAVLCTADLDTVDGDAALKRGWTALSQCVPGLTP